MAEKKEQQKITQEQPNRKMSLAELIASLMYFEGIKPEKRKEAIKWEKLTEAEQDSFIAQASKFLLALDRLNLAPLPKLDMTKMAQDEQRNLDILISIIKKFVSGLTTTRPNLFPYEELALRIMHPEPEKKEGTSEI